MTTLDKVKVSEKLIANLPKIALFLFPEGYELLPNTSELFELEFAFYEYQVLTKEEIIHRGAFFKAVDGNPTNHYIICSNNSPLTWQGRAEIIKSHFRFSQDACKNCVMSIVKFDTKKEQKYDEKH